MAESIGRRFAPPFLIAIALAIAYSNAWNTAFVFDDHHSIVGNPVVVSESLWVSLVQPDKGTVGGAPLSRRPLSAFSFALNYRLFGMSPAGFRAGNLLLHFASSWLLFGLLRRTFARCSSEGVRRDAFPLAAGVALLWAVHPLQTAVVTYTVQRAEGLAAFCYLATLLCFVRAAEARERGRRNVSIWIGSAVVACYAGMASKEVMVSAPLTVLLYDRVFISHSFREVWRRHGFWHLAIFSSWILLAVQVARLVLGNQLAGSYMGSTPATYLVSQSYFICRYVFLVFWPLPLVLDYGFAPVLDPRWVVPCGAIVLCAIAWTLRAARRTPELAFLGYVFFAVLSVTSSVVTIGTQIAAEHRMYLPSVVPIALALLLGHRLLTRRVATAARRRAIGLLLVAVVATGLSARTWARNRMYATEIRIWEDTVEKVPGNVRALTILAGLYRDEVFKGVDPETRESLLGRALALADRAVALEPDYGSAFISRGEIRLARGDREGAMADFDRAVEVFPSDPLGWYNRGRMFHREDPAAAEADYTRALEVGPGFVVAAINRGRCVFPREDPKRLSPISTTSSTTGRTTPWAGRTGASYWDASAAARRRSRAIGGPSTSTSSWSINRESRWNAR